MAGFRKYWRHYSRTKIRFISGHSAYCVPSTPAQSLLRLERLQGPPGAAASQVMGLLETASYTSRSSLGIMSPGFWAKGGGPVLLLRFAEAGTLLYLADEAVLRAGAADGPAPKRLWGPP
ncbi:hypothetical protein CB1_000130029 [Camelus ferus]|nr:hypothetical protein CB1_000130029 [Camelus ferus]